MNKLLERLDHSLHLVDGIANKLIGHRASPPFANTRQFVTFRYQLPPAIQLDDACPGHTAPGRCPAYRQISRSTRASCSAFEAVVSSPAARWKAQFPNWHATSPEPLPDASAAPRAKPRLARPGNAGVSSLRSRSVTQPSVPELGMLVWSEVEPHSALPMPIAFSRSHRPAL